MDINLLKIFIAVCDNKSISKAAKELNFTQSNVTLRVKQLEKSLNIKFFHRVPKGVTLTLSAKKLYPYAKDIIKNMDEAVAKINNEKFQEQIIIGSTQSNATIRLSKFIEKLHSDFPQTKIKIHTDATPFTLEKLLSYKLDIAFLSKKPLSDKLIILKTFKEQMYIVSAKNKKCKNAILGYQSHCEYFNFLKNYQEKMGNIEFESIILENYEMILGCAKVGMGISLLPFSIISKYGYENELNLKRLSLADDILSTRLLCLKDNEPMISEYLRKIKL